MTVGPRALIFSDSLSFYGPEGPMPADDPRLWPNLLAEALDGHVEVFAGYGWTARDAWWSLTGDPRVWAELPKIDVLVLAVGNMDTLPSPLPTYLRQGLRHLRPPGLRRAARTAYLAAQPHLARLFRGRPVALPPAQTVEYLTEVVEAIRVLRPDLPIIGVLPGVHRAATYGGVHTGRQPAVDAMCAWSDRAGVPLVDLAVVTTEHVYSGNANPDGMHWGWQGHRLVGEAFAKAIWLVLKADRVLG
jgi:hypothetical protein